MYRPLSPHIFIYKPQSSSLFSVFHRTTGIVLSLGLLFFICLVSASYHHITHYSIYWLWCFLNTYGAWFLVAVAIVCLFSFCLHLFGGIRHILWDLAPDKFLDKKQMSAQGVLTLGFALLSFGIVFFQYF